MSASDEAPVRAGGFMAPGGTPGFGAPPLLGRAGQDERLLPPITPHLYVAPHFTQANEGRRLLASALVPLPFRKRVLGHGLSSDEQLRRVVWMHAQAFAAELAGQVERADAFWDRGAALLRELLATHAARPSFSGPDLPQRLLDELFIDTHCALYNGLVLHGEWPAPEGRAFAHAERLIALTRLGVAGPERYLALLGPLYAARAAAYEAAGLPAQALAAHEALAAFAPASAEAARPLERAVGELLAPAPIRTAAWQSTASSDAGRRPNGEGRTNAVLAAGPGAGRPDVSGFAGVAEAAALTPVPPARFQLGEPLDLWLFSRRDSGLKLLVAVAALLLGLAGALTAREALSGAARDAAYARLMDAAARADYGAMVDAAPGFLRAPPLAGSDARAAQVRDLYTEAFVRWFTTLDEAEVAAAQPRVDQFRALMGATLEDGR